MDVLKIEFCRFEECRKELCRKFIKFNSIKNYNTKIIAIAIGSEMCGVVRVSYFVEGECYGTKTVHYDTLHRQPLFTLDY